MISGHNGCPAGNRQYQDPFTDPATAGHRVLAAMDRLPDLIESGAFAGIRKPPLTDWTAQSRLER